MRARAALGVLFLGIAAARATGWDAYDRGVEALAKGACAAAVESFTEAVAADGRESARKNPYGMKFSPYYPHLKLAEAHLCSGRGDLALESLQESEAQGAAPARDVKALRERAEQLDDGASLLLWRARAAFREGKALWAQGLLSQAAAKAPGHPGIPELRAAVERSLEVERLATEARVLLSKGEHARGAAQAKQALLLEPTHEEARATLREAERAARPVAAPSPATSPEWPAPSPSPAARASGPSAEVERLLREARILLEQDEPARALQLATRALELDPARRDVVATLDAAAAALMAIGRAPAAKAGPSPEDRATFGDAIRAYHAGSYEQALALLARAQPSQGGSPAYHIYVGAAYCSRYLLGDAPDPYLLQSAEQAFRRARAIAPELEPDARWFSPRIVEVYRAAGLQPQEEPPTGGAP